MRFYGLSSLPVPPLTSSRRRIYALLLATAVCILVLASYIYYQSSLPPRILDSQRPSTWEWLKTWEARLPQHDLTVSAPDGATARFVKFSTQAQGLGWNNILADLLTNAHIAHESGRGLVFPDYTWEGSHYPFPEASARQWPPHTPLNALISGPTAGGPWDALDDTPRSISSDWFDVVCPASERRIVTSDTMKKNLANQDGLTALEGYATILRDLPDRCVEIVSSPTDSWPQLYDMWIWGEPRLLSLWDSFSKSPVSTLLEPSPIVRAAVDRNAYLFLPRGPRPSHGHAVFDSVHGILNKPSLYDRVLAIHLRRGDFEGACKGFARYSSNFNGWNQLAFLPDRLLLSSNEDERVETYRRRCSPTPEEILTKVREARRDFQDANMGFLDMVYILTNEKGEWIQLVIEALRNDRWTTVVTSLDLHYDNVEQQEVGMAIDMEIARLSAVFVGNGWSSFTSNIVHRRLVNQRPPISLRFY